MSRALLATLSVLLAAPILSAEKAAETPAPEPAAAAPTPAEPPPGLLLDKVVALVNDGIVTESELDERITQTAADLRRNNTQPPAPDVLRRAVLDRLVMDEIQWQRAKRAGVEVSDETVNSALQQLAQSNGLTLAQLPQVLAQDGINYASFRESYRRDIARQQLRRREVLNRVMQTITPREVEQYVERLKKLPNERSEYNYSHILIALPSDATQDQVNATAQRAEDVFQKAATEDFGALAVTYSNSQTALEGGQMGWVSGAQLPPTLTEAIASLKVGEVSKPVASPYGYHIVKLNQVRSAEGDAVEQQVHARHILLTTNALQDDATVRQRLAGVREQVLAGADFAAFASSMSEDQSSAVNGGDLEWQGPGATVPEFEAAMSRLKEGEISEPFQTQFGWHIVQVLGRRQFDTTDEQLRQRAFVQLRDGKSDQELELWLRRLRDEAFVDTELN